jgi:hypothetical protein
MHLRRLCALALTALAVAGGSTTLAGCRDQRDRQGDPDGSNNSSPTGGSPTVTATPTNGGG